MTDDKKRTMYLRRVTSTAASQMPNPWLRVVTTIAVPLAISILGYLLLRAVNIDSGSAADSLLRHALVRAAVTQALDVDLGTDRLVSILSQTRARNDMTPCTNAQAQERTTIRTGYLRTIATRLNAQRGRLADTLTTTAMIPHPLTLKGTTAGEVVTQRLSDDVVTHHTREWATQTLDADPHASRLGECVVTDSSP